MDRRDPVVSAGLRLHHHPGNASLIAHILLREIGVPFELAFVDRDKGAHRSPDYLALNPNGQIPVLEDDREGRGLVLFETAAICLHLADAFPQAALAPPLGTNARAECYKWLAWSSASLQPALMAWFYPERWVDAGAAAAAAQVRAHAQARIHGMLDLLDAQLASHGGPWVLGDAFGIVDPYAFTLCRWTRGFVERPARARQHIGPFLQRMLARPAVREALAAEGLAEPFV
jgi:glutathione S-transferase